MQTQDTLLAAAPLETQSMARLWADPETRGLLLGLLGITMFALTPAMTRLAVGTSTAPLMTGEFVAMGRAALAGLLAGAMLLAIGARLPGRADWYPLVMTSMGVVLGFPLLNAWAMRYVEATHASVISGLQPLLTAVLAAALYRQRHALGFWLCAALGSALVLGFAMLRSGAGMGSIQVADGLLLLGMLFGSVGYAYGGQLAQRMPATQVISWALVLGLPITLPVSLWAWPQTSMPASAWGALAYVALFSMWIGFFAWYRGLALGGTVRVSQVQLMQPFLSMLFAVPLLGESLDAVSIGFALAVLATAIAGRRMPAPRLNAAS
jgi:drug/metabolite transporter (DMT)-like permease